MWLKDQNFQNMDIERDAKGIVDALYNNSCGFSDFQVLINNCRIFF